MLQKGNNSEEDLTAVLRYSLLGNISKERQKYYNSINESQSQNLKKQAKKQGYLHDDGHHLTQKGRDYLFEKIKGEIKPITKEQFDKILRKSPENQSGEEKKIYHIMNTLGRMEGKSSYSGEIDVKKEPQKLQEWRDYAKKNNLAICEFSHSKNVKELYFYNPKVFNACIKK